MIDKDIMILLPIGVPTAMIPIVLSHPWATTVVHVPRSAFLLFRRSVWICRFAIVVIT